MHLNFSEKGSVGFTRLLKGSMAQKRLKYQNTTLFTEVKPLNTKRTGSNVCATDKNMIQLFN